MFIWDLAGNRVKKTVGSISFYYPFAHYEISGTTVVKYYFFNGQRVAMKVGSSLTYLHSDHWGSTVLETNASGAVATDEKYFAFGKQRDSGKVTTDHRFTGQKEDGSGLVYMNARFFDPLTGMFVSPDSRVPDPGNVFAYNRTMYAYGNTLKYNDPTGHDPACAAAAPVPPIAIGCEVIQAAIQYGPTIVQLASQWADKVPAMWDWMFSADQAENSAASNNASSGNTGGSGGWDPKDPWGSFRNLKIAERHIDALKSFGDKIDLEKTYNQYSDLIQKGVNITGHAVGEAQQEKISTQQIVDTYTGAARAMQYYTDGSRIVQFSPYTKVALLIERTTKEIVTVYARTVPQKGWQAMSAFDILKWVEEE